MTDQGPRPKPGLAPNFDELVTVHQLRLLRAVVERGGFSRAADALGLSQPAVSHQLKALSTAVGMPVLEIVGRRVQLTQAGQLLYEHAQRILGEFEAAGHESGILEFGEAHVEQRPRHAHAASEFTRI